MTLELEYDMQAGLEERRSAERVPCRVLVHHVDGNELRLYETIEVSEVGCLLRARSEGHPSPGARVTLTLRLPGRCGEICVSGLVVGEVGGRNDVFALAFGELVAVDRSALRAFVAEACYAMTARAMVRSQGARAALSA